MESRTHTIPTSNTALSPTPQAPPPATTTSSWQKTTGANIRSANAATAPMSIRAHRQSPMRLHQQSPICPKSIRQLRARQCPIHLRQIPIHPRQSPIHPQRIRPVRTLRRRRRTAVGSRWGSMAMRIRVRWWMEGRTRLF